MQVYFLVKLFHLLEPSDDSITILNAFHFDPKHFPKLKDAMMGAVVNFARKKLENLGEGEFQPPPHMLLQFPDHESPNDNFIVVQKFYRHDFKVFFIYLSVNLINSLA
jgi:hypothetical protein